MGHSVMADILEKGEIYFENWIFFFFNFIGISMSTKNIGTILRSFVHKTCLIFRQRSPISLLFPLGGH